jgi:hypothetical protein
MPDMRLFDDGPHDPLLHCLRALPECAPDSDGWPRLAAELRALQARTIARPVRRRRVLTGLALAATVLLALLLPRGGHGPLPGPGTAGTPAPGTDPLAALVAQSQWLETLVSAPALAPDAQDSDQVLLDWGLRQHISVIDQALQVAAAGEARQQLWQARVDALSQLLQVRWASRREGLHDGMADGAALRPTVLWSN